MNEYKRVVTLSDGVVKSYSFYPDNFALPAGGAAQGTLVLDYNVQVHSVNWFIQTVIDGGGISLYPCKAEILDYNDFECNFLVDAKDVRNRQKGTVQIGVEINYWEGAGIVTTTEMFSCEYLVLPEFVIESGTTSGDTTESGSTTGGTTGSTTTGVIGATPISLYFRDLTPSSLIVNSTTNNVESWDVDYGDMFDVRIVSTGSSECLLEVTPRHPIDEQTYSTSLRIIAHYSNSESETTVPITILGFKAIPIWEDYYYTFANRFGETVKYELEDANTGEIIYSGSANRYPNSNETNINLSRIVSNYLSTHFPKLMMGSINYREQNYSKKVNVKTNNTIVATFLFYDSWGYEPIPGNYNLSKPIRKYVDRRQCFIWSMFNPTLTPQYVNYRLEDSKNQLQTIRSTAQLTNNQSIFIDRYLSDFITFDYIVIGGERIKIVDTCNEYCLYYKNAFNGWDSLLVGGNVVKSDKMNSQYYTKTFDNRTHEFGKTKYLNIINQNYTLHTDWFNDEEQSLFYHLLESTEVYLHNLNTNELQPVNITNNTCEYKTFTNNGKKKWYNTINVEVAQERIRH